FDPVLGDHDVSVDTGDGMEYSEFGSVGETGALISRRRLFGDLEAQALPPAQGRCDLRSRAGACLPRQLHAVAARLDGLGCPHGIDGTAQHTGSRPFDMRT